MKNSYLKALTSGLAAFLVMSGFFAHQAFAGKGGGPTAPPVITSASTKTCVVGSACSYQITATNSPTSYGATALPTGLTVNTNTGLISGTPTTAGASSVTVSATNAIGTDSLAVTFTINLPPAPPARVVVAPSGGNYTTITAAMDAINPTEANPYVVEVWPGVYTEPGTTVTLKSHVHLKGSGRDVTTIKPTSTGASVPFILADSLTNVTISGLTITGGGIGVSFLGSSGTIRENSVSNNQRGIVLRDSLTPSSALITQNSVVANSNYGVEIMRSSATITDNYISGNGNGNGSIAVYLSDAVNTVVNGNVIRGNNAGGIGNYNYDTSLATAPIMSNNVIADNTQIGVFFYYESSTGTLINNKITNNGGAAYADIIINHPPSVLSLSPNISFNVFDDIVGTRGVGSYNVDSNGDPILVP